MTDDSGNATARITFQDFLEKTGPSVECAIEELCSLTQNQRRYYRLTTPELHLHCDHERCNGLRYFRHKTGETEFRGERFRTYLTYLCSNCQEREKLFSLHIAMDLKPDDIVIDPFTHPGPFAGSAYKFGEYPPFGPKTPTKLQKLLDDQLDVFMKGRRCETQGLGIGAFVYYRRVVEHQKNRFLTEIISAAKLLRAADAQIAALEAAKDETQFTKAVMSVKDALPQALLMDGHNPLTLLHSALSAGVHEHSDAECLELARDIRVVLADLAERLSQVLKDNAELKGAVSRLLKKKAATAK